MGLYLPRLYSPQTSKKYILRVKEILFKLVTKSRKPYRHAYGMLFKISAL